ncbi:FAD-binding protein [Dyella subtropica]|uniref:FAD-dependent oxidoreductase n=1 Tax=Dyella subtropica TaxID=2992127 RepID=UPI00225A9772|nr:FAD-binding oxidoreductase [Dyella subtropica]
MKRRDLLKAALTVPLLPFVMRTGFATTPRIASAVASAFRSRVRPSDPGWPSATAWDGLKRNVGGRLLKLESPFAHCQGTTSDAVCADALKHLDNPFALGDQPALTQTSGWADAWTSQPSVYAVAAETTADVVAAVNFARKHHLRLVVKGGGHSYQGTSDAPDSLLVWTRRMNKVTLHDHFVAQGCAGRVEPQPAVTVQAGAMWIDAYHAVTTQGGRYVQGGGCTTVGVAGLVQSGGFGNFSKQFGTAAANLLEAEIVTADGVARIANACTNPELFWGIKGGGGGSLGVVTRLTLRTFELPPFFGAVFGTIKASSREAFRALIVKAMDFYQSALFNPHWGEQISFRDGDTLNISMVFQGLTQQQAEQTWAPFLDWIRGREEYTFTKPLQVTALPARHFWDAEFFREHAPKFIVSDDRPNAPRHHTLWAGDQDQVGWFIHSYQSAWLPAALLRPEQPSRLADALFTASQHYDFELHFNKGLAGGSQDAIARARDTATNPQVLEAFALAICGSAGGPAFPGMPGLGPDLPKARRDAAGVDKAMDALRAVAPGAGSYVSESDYFLRDWQQGFWGSNYARLANVKRKYDPDGLFFVHHGVGSESWSEDGFTRLHDGERHS